MKICPNLLHYLFKNSFFFEGGKLNICSQGLKQTISLQKCYSFLSQMADTSMTILSQDWYRTISLSFIVIYVCSFYLLVKQNEYKRKLCLWLGLKLRTFTFLLFRMEGRLGIAEVLNSFLCSWRVVNGAEGKIAQAFILSWYALGGKTSCKKNYIAK